MKELLGELSSSLKQEFGYSNIHQVPKLSKIVINVGCGDSGSNPKAVDACCYMLSTISGQKPVVRRAKKSIAGFKLRQGNPNGVSVTLRGEKMWSFLKLLLGVALPRVRDFRGLSTTAFDGRGNYSIGIREQVVFPQVDIDKLETRVRGLGIQVVTTATSDKEAFALLRGLGFPFKKK